MGIDSYYTKAVSGWFGQLVDGAAGLVSVGAGLYLLQYNETFSVGGSGTSWFQILAHGIGIYFIGKGLFVWRSLYYARRAAEGSYAVAVNTPALKEDDAEIPEELSA